jgi:nicotinic acid phosphoribosyltransferase
MRPTNPLLTDLYQLTMLQAYYERGMTEAAAFELFVRKRLPISAYRAEIAPALRALAEEVDRDAG